MKTTAAPGRPGRNKSDKKRLALSAMDWQAVEYVRARHGCRTQSDAIRLCLRQQRIRDVVMRPGKRPKGHADDESILIGGRPDPVQYSELTAGVVTAVREGRYRGPMKAGDDAVPMPAAAVLKQWLCRFWPEDLAAIDEIRGRWELPTFVDAIRMAVRVQARLDGFIPMKNTWV